jgi:hypothetical protein
MCAELEEVVVQLEEKQRLCKDADGQCCFMSLKNLMFLVEVENRICDFEKTLNSQRLTVNKHMDEVSGAELT